MTNRIITTLFAFFILATNVISQEKKADCQDVVYLKGRSVFRGTITEYKTDGYLVMTTWSGGQIQVPAINVNRIVQKCKEDKPVGASSPRPAYSFEETGWYHATRMSVLFGSSGIGAGVQHSSGIKINRLIGIGIGAGLENFDPFDAGVTTFPIFAEMRGYFLPKSISPFYAVGVGYGISGNSKDDGRNDGAINQWRGGYLLQGHLGYRIGNHGFIQLGIRLQHKTRRWENIWSGVTGVDQLLYKRLDIGFGLLL
jgi:hypothetical protein